MYLLFSSVIILTMHLKPPIQTVTTELAELLLQATSAAAIYEFVDLQQVIATTVYEVVKPCFICIGLVLI